MAEGKEDLYWRTYNPASYPRHDDYYDAADVIPVDAAADIPQDYCGAMAVPIALVFYLAKRKPGQFEVVGFARAAMKRGGSLAGGSGEAVPGALSGSFPIPLQADSALGLGIPALAAGSHADGVSA